PSSLQARDALGNRGSTRDRRTVNRTRRSRALRTWWTLLARAAVLGQSQEVAARAGETGASGGGVQGGHPPTRARPGAELAPRAGRAGAVPPLGAPLL